ncbi:MAG: RluA family pseudouridine synthase [Treponema sp.]
MKPIPDYTVIYFDSDIVALNKRSGLLIAADRYDPSALRLDLEAQKEFGKLYAVHRIDKDTSGLIVYARTQEAHKNLSAQFENRRVEKIYHCIVYGRPLWTETTVDLPLLPDGDARHRTTVNKSIGKPSVTHFRRIGGASSYSWIEAKPQTGRTHQIRAHLAALGLSIVCDPLYGGCQKPLRLSEVKRKWRGDEYEERPLVSRLALHAYALRFTHPESGQTLNLSAPYPKDMEAARRQFVKLFKVDPLAPADDTLNTIAQKTNVDAVTHEA